MTTSPPTTTIDHDNINANPYEGIGAAVARDGETAVRGAAANAGILATPPPPARYACCCCCDAAAAGG